ncbi:MAG: glycosyltransferase family 9 protein [Deferribacteres bacterium]|nr:glycosyltransferase family 9 protein [Deferribacteres bacterium]
MRWIRSASDEKNELRRAVQGEKIGRILLVRCQKIGDMLTFLPTVLCVRKLFPSAEITLLCHRDGLPVAERIPWVKLIVIDSHKRKRLDSGTSFDLMITSSQDAGWIVLKKRHKIKFAVGVLPESLRGVCLKHRWQYRYFTDTERYSYADHDVQRNLKVLNALGSLKCDTDSWTLWINPSEKERISALIADGPGPLVLISPSGSKHSQNWSPDFFAVLCDRLIRERNVRIVIVGKGDIVKEQTERILEKMKEQALSLVNRTSFGELCALIERSDLLISVDSGTAHVASYLNRPLVVIFGPGYLEQWGPWHQDKSRSAALKAACKCGTTLFRCLERKHCLDSIMPDDVFEKAVNFLDNPV